MMKTNYTYIYLSLFLIFLIGCSEDKLDLTSRGIITGKVVTVGDNAPMENVKISTNPVTSIVFTDSEGNFQINDVPIDNYSVQAEKEGYLTQFEGITITDNSTVNVVFEMDVETANNRPPNAPVLHSPSDNATDQEVELDLIWSGSDDDNDTLTYTLEVLNDQNSEVLEFTNLTDTTYTVSGLQYGTKYFWQVSASDDINEPTLSDIFSFETLPFPDHRHFFVRKIDGNNVIFSSDLEGNEIQLTSENTNSWRPRKAHNIDKLAFLGTNGGVTHVFTMNLDGSDVFQVTNAVPVNGFNMEEMDISWRANDSRILYSSFDKLYQIAPDGSSLQELHQTSNGNFITEIDWNQQTARIALKTNDNVGYNVSIYTINVSGVVQDIVLENVPGAAGGLNYSFDGSKLLYTYDTSGNENPQYRQLDTDMFIYDFNTLSADNVSAGKPVGTNDLDARFSPSGAEIIFVNTSNDGISQNDVHTVTAYSPETRALIFEDSKMPDWR